nr:hypothetical protein [Pseudomonas sp. BIGb0427]
MRRYQRSGLVIGEDGLDLRLNLRAWYWIGMAHDAGGYRLSVFDRHGKVLLRLASTEQSSMAGWAGLYEQCIDKPAVFSEPPSFSKRDLQVPGLVEEWAAMANVHEHFALLKRHGLTRYEGNALVARILPGNFRRPARWRCSVSWPPARWS